MARVRTRRAARFHSANPPLIRRRALSADPGAWLLRDGFAILHLNRTSLPMSSPSISDRGQHQFAPNDRRCSWVGTDPLMVAYHDTEWGVPVHDDQKLFEFMVLDAMQAGLNFWIILDKN